MEVVGDEAHCAEQNYNFAPNSFILEGDVFLRFHLWRRFDFLPLTGV
jgi:hypothetical protein